MKWAPLFLDLSGYRCLLVGGGQVALRKARLLAQMKAVLDVIAPKTEPELVTLVAKSGGSVQQKAFADTDLRSQPPVLVVAATNDTSVNRMVAEASRAANIWVNVVDTSELCTFIFPSIVNRSPFILAVSSGGKAPVLLRQWRERIEALLPARLGRLVDFAASFRDRVKIAWPDATARRRFWEVFFSGAAAGALLAGQRKKAEQLAEAMFENSQTTVGEVYLVGAGPGDPDLLTLRALHLMQQADVVLYDNLVSQAVLELCRRDATRIYVGKKRKHTAFRQEEITQLMISHARAGERVLRLKGGDPFVFGRGGEEVTGLAEQGISFQVVPGITAANGCAAYANIPLTHRDYAQSVRFITGHLRRDEMHLDWPELARPGQTLVFYMGRKNLPFLTETLLEKGRAPDTPIAVIENGTLPEQRVFISDLAHINSLLEKETLMGPTTAIIGDVVRLRERLNFSP